MPVTLIYFGENGIQLCIDGRWGQWTFNVIYKKLYSSFGLTKQLTVCAEFYRICINNMNNFLLQTCLFAFDWHRVQQDCCYFRGIFCQRIFSRIFSQRAIENIQKLGFRWYDDAGLWNVWNTFENAWDGRFNLLEYSICFRFRWLMLAHTWTMLTDLVGETLWCGSHWYWVSHFVFWCTITIT